jgi:hypothetical protein
MWWEEQEDQRRDHDTGHGQNRRILAQLITQIGEQGGSFMARTFNSTMMTFNPKIPAQKPESTGARWPHGSIGACQPVDGWHEPYDVDGWRPGAQQLSAIDR